MGRWAQRNRAGGGNSINFLMSAMQSGTDTADARFLLPVSVSDFNATDFILVGVANCTMIAQADSHTLRCTFDDDVTPGDQFRYAGDTPGVISPTEVLVQ